MEEAAADRATLAARIVDRCSLDHHRLRDEGLGLLSLFTADGPGLR